MAPPKGFKHSAASKARIAKKMRLSRAVETPEKKAARYSKRKPLSEETKRRISQSHLGLRHTDEAKAKMSFAKSGNVRKPHSAETIEKIRQRKLGTKHSPESIAKMIGHPAYHRRGKLPDYKGIKMRSSYEVRTAKALDALDIKWEYEPRRFWFDKFTYTPDFYLPSEGAYWEVKGWYHAHGKAKVEAFRTAYPEIPLVVFTLPCLEILEASAQLSL